MVIRRGEIWWADMSAPMGAEPGFRRPILILQADAWNRSRLRTVVGVALTSNNKLAALPGNVLLPARVSGLPVDSVANVTQIVTIDRQVLTAKAGRLNAAWTERVAEGVRLVLDL